MEAANFALNKVYIMLCGSNFGTRSGSSIHSLSDLSSIRVARSNLHFNFRHIVQMLDFVVWMRVLVNVFQSGFLPKVKSLTTLFVSIAGVIRL